MKMVENLRGNWKGVGWGGNAQRCTIGRKIRQRSVACIINGGQVLRPVAMETAPHQTNMGAGMH